MRIIEYCVLEELINDWYSPKELQGKYIHEKVEIILFSGKCVVCQVFE